MLKKELNIKIDYLSIVFDTIKADELIRRLLGLLLDYFMIQKAKVKHKDYTNLYQFGTIKVYGDRKLKDGTDEVGGYLILSGQGCDDYYSFLKAGNNTYNNFFDYCIQIAGKGSFHLTRLDIAIDDRNDIPYFTVEQIKHKYLKDEFVSKSKSYRFAESSFDEDSAKTDMMGLKQQFKSYLKANKINEKKLTDVELSKLKDQFYTQAFTTSFEHTVYNKGLLSGISTTLDYIPVVGGVKNVIEGIDGKTMTGEELTSSERLQYALLGVVSAGVDVITFGSATPTIQGTKTLAKEFGKFAMKDVAVGWAQNVGSNALSQLHLPSQLAFMTHIGYNVGSATRREMRITENHKV